VGTQADISRARPQPNSVQVLAQATRAPFPTPLPPCVVVCGCVRCIGTTAPLPLRRVCKDPSPPQLVGTGARAPQRNAPPPTVVHAGLLVLGLLAQCMPEVFKPQLPQLVAGLGLCLSHTVRDVQLAALRASSLFIQVRGRESECVRACVVVVCVHVCACVRACVCVHVCGVWVGGCAFVCGRAPNLQPFPLAPCTHVHPTMHSRLNPHERATDKPRPRAACPPPRRPWTSPRTVTSSRACCRPCWPACRPR